MCHHLNWLQIWPPDGATCIDYKFSHQVALLESVAILATRWCHLHQLKIGPPRGTTCIRSNFGHQVATLALLGSKVVHQNVSLPLSHFLGMLYMALSVSIELHQSESHQFSRHKVFRVSSDRQPDRPINRTPGTPGSDKNSKGCH